jgi:hypothetical protein
MTRFVSTLILLLMTAASARAALLDHLQCYKVKDSVTKAIYSADLTPSEPALVAPPTCKVKVPAKLLCVATDKTNVNPPPPGSPAGSPAQTYLCYKVKCPKVQPTLNVQDQFGSHSVLVKGASLLCAPAPAVTTTTTITFSTTTTVTTSTTTTTVCGVEVCNGVDDDCDMAIDEGLGSTTCGVGACQVTVQNCVGGVPQMCTPGTPSPEICNNIDDDCNGLVDEGGAGCPALPNANATCNGGVCGVGSCNVGYADCNGQGVDGCEVYVFGDPNNCGGCNVSCNDGNPCTTDGCNNFACFHSQQPNNFPCPGGTCQAGVCTP